MKNLLFFLCPNLSGQWRHFERVYIPLNRVGMTTDINKAIGIFGDNSLNNITTRLPYLPIMHTDLSTQLSRMLDNILICFQERLPIISHRYFWQSKPIFLICTNISRIRANLRSIVDSDCRNVLSRKIVYVPEFGSQRKKSGGYLSPMAGTFVSGIVRKLFAVLLFQKPLPAIQEARRQHCGEESKRSSRQGLKFTDEINNTHTRNYGDLSGLTQLGTS